MSKIEIAAIFCNIKKLPILHPVWAEPLNHIAYLTHKSICSYKKL